MKRDLRSTLDLEKIHRQAVLVYEKASKLALENFRKNVEYKVKSVEGVESIVTKVDKILDKYLTTELCKLIPGSGYLSEETGSTLSNRYNWIIDPIDGTANYQRGVDLWGILISLKDGQETIYACMITPTLLEKMIYAIKGKGVFNENGSKLKMTKSDGFKVKFSVDSSNREFKIWIFIQEFGFKTSHMKTGAVIFNAYSLLRGGYEFMLIYDLPIYDVDAVCFMAGQLGFKVAYLNDENYSFDKFSSTYKYRVLIAKPDINDKIVRKVKKFITEYEK